MAKLVIKAILMIAITMALSLAILTTKSTTSTSTNTEKPSNTWPKQPALQENLATPPRKRMSRFLAESGADARNPRAADHCTKDNEICQIIEPGQNLTCCNNKCIDLTTDHNHCGACKQKCYLTHTCCRGECVNIAFDKRHCGACNHRCMPGGYCIYGMCDYA